MNPRRDRWGVRLSVALYRVILLLAFPPGFRGDVQEEMLQTFRARAGDTTGGGAGLPTLWARTLADLAWHGAAEWFAAARRAGAPAVRGWTGDFRQAVRSLRADPSFTLVALTTLALGVGANSAVFSVADAVLFRPLPYSQAERIVQVWRLSGTEGGRQNFSYPDLADVAAAQTTFDHLAPYAHRGATVEVGEVGVRVEAALTPPAFFDVMGVEPREGRVYHEATPDRTLRMAVLGSRLANSFPGGVEPGSTIRVDGLAYTVTGVMPRDFDFPVGVQLWLPVEADDERGSSWLLAVGRMAFGVTALEAEADVASLVQTLEVRFPGRYQRSGARIEPLREAFAGRVRPTLLLLLGTAAIVLLIACTNLAGLSMVRAASRADDIRVRVALGATRGAVARLAVTEGLILSLAGAGVGLPVAVWGAQALVRLAPSGMGGLNTVGIDPRVLVFTGLVAIATGVLFTLAPALRAAELAASGSVGAGRRASADRRGGRVRAGMVSGEVALAVVLLMGAGLLVRSLVNLHQVPIGFDPGTVRSLPVTLAAGGGTGDSLSVAGFVAEARRRLHRVPGVSAVAAIAYPPLGGSQWGTRVHAEGTPIQPRPQRYLARYNAVSPGYFEALQIPLVAGRTFMESDGADGAVAVVSESLAHTLWPGRDPLGRRLTNLEPDARPEWLTVVGVVGDVRNEGLTVESRGEAYQPYTQLPLRRVTFLIDGRWDDALRPTAVREALKDTRPSVAVPPPQPLVGAVAAARSRTRFGATLLAGFAALAVGLASLGVYGMIAYSVGRRRRELGIRVALGARPSELARVGARSGLAPAAAGTLVGVGLALATTRWIESLLFEVDAADPLTLAAVTALMLLIAAGASAVPALRAARVDPRTALQSD